MKNEKYQSYFEKEKVSENITTGLDRYPEFKPLVDSLFRKYITPMINDMNRQARQIQSEMPYKEQFVFEEIIKEMQDLV